MVKIKEGEKNKFDMFITTCIVINTIMMTLVHYDQSDTWSTIFTVSDILFFCIYFLKLLLKSLLLDGEYVCYHI